MHSASEIKPVQKVKYKDMLFRISISDGAIFKLEEGLVFRNKSWSFVTGYSTKREDDSKQR